MVISNQNFSPKFQLSNSHFLILNFSKKRVQKKIIMTKNKTR